MFAPPTLTPPPAFNPDAETDPVSNRAPGPGVKAPGGTATGRAVSGRARTEAHRRFEANKALIHATLARRFPRIMADQDAAAEAWSAGALGLLSACERYDPARGVAFSTFAVTLIVGSVRHWLRDQARSRRLPIAGSLDDPLGDDGATRGELMEDTRGPCPGQKMLDGAGFDALLAGLSGRQRQVIEAVYGEGQTLAQIEAGWNVAPGRASEVHRQALATLRKQMPSLPA